ncbi:MAG: IS110 family transposase [Desulfobacterales bacterium]|nr:IS110 family transposase [Desulfobacterales bacterium]MDD4073881.1 IS110 family transposase [Desulfobacterales bacterium]MDD4393886.1 IS110 family transposase [Desulfobacterales bacterium]
MLDCLEPYKKDLQGVVVESTYNWYWLVDGLQDHGYKILLANPAAIKQYEGIKYSDDKWDALWLAHMLKLGILPQGYIYPKETRPMRDMLRRRMLFVRQRTADILSFQSMITRNTGGRISVNNIKKLTEESLGQLFSDPDLFFLAQRYLSIIELLSQQVKMIEKQAMGTIGLSERFKWLSTITGVGKILAMTIMMEVGDIARFEKVGNYCSYCRCVSSERISNGKKKGVGNKKNGNKYLSWAYVEAANFCIRHNAQAERFYQRKKAKSNGIVAIKALSNKLARASYYIMRDQVPFNSQMLFA